MKNPYPAPCRYCGGTVASEEGTVEKIGQSFQAAHRNCSAAMSSRYLSLLTMGLVPPMKRRTR